MVEMLALSNVDYAAIPDLHVQAYDLATKLNLSKGYDAYYLVVAQERQCEFWTADRRLVNAVSTQYPWVHWIGDYSPTNS